MTVACACDPSTAEVEARGPHQFTVISPTRLRPDRVTYRIPTQSNKTRQKKIWVYSLEMSIEDSQKWPLDSCNPPILVFGAFELGHHLCSRMVRYHKQKLPVREAT